MDYGYVYDINELLEWQLSIQETIHVLTTSSDDPTMPVDTCADTFAANDLCIAFAVGDVGLFPLPEDLTRPRAGTGVWDGTNIVGFVDQDGIRDPLLWSYYKEMKYFPRYEDIPREFDINVSTVRLDFDLVLPPVPMVEPAPGMPPEPARGQRNLSAVLNRLSKFVQNPICFDESFDFVHGQEGAAQRFLSELAYPGLRERFFINGLDYSVLELYLGYEEALSTLR